MLTPFERFLGMPAPFGELVSVDAFEEVSGVHRLRFQAAETLLQVFTNRTSGVLDVGGARALWPIHQEVALRFATRYGIAELEVVLRRTRQAVVGDADEDSGVVGEEAPVCMGLVYLFRN